MTYDIPRLLITDENMTDYMPLRKALVDRFPKETKIVWSESLAESINITANEFFPAVLVAYRLPDGHGTDLISTIKERYQGLGYRPVSFFLIIDPEVDNERYFSILNDYPYVTLVDKPYRPSEVAGLVFDAILPQFSEGMGYYNLGLYDLIQAYVLSRSSVTLRVFNRQNKMGMISIRGGRLIHASTENIKGLDALALIAAMPEARIRLEKGCATALETITLTRQEALCEAARYIREGTQAGKPRDRSNDTTDYSGSPRLVRISDENDSRQVFALHRNKNAPGTDEVPKIEREPSDEESAETILTPEGVKKLKWPEPKQRTSGIQQQQTRLETPGETEPSEEAETALADQANERTQLVNYDETIVSSSEETQVVNSDNEKTIIRPFESEEA